MKKVTALVMFLTGTLNSSRKMYNSLSVLTIFNMWQAELKLAFSVSVWGADYGGANGNTFSDKDQEHRVTRNVQLGCVVVVFVSSISVV